MAHWKRKMFFFRTLNNELIKCKGNNIILTGDFNGVMKPKRDRESKKKIQNNQGKLPSSCLELIEEHELTDVWPYLYKGKKGFTYYSEVHNSSSRLDMFFTSKKLTTRLKKMEIAPRVMSDHNLIEVTIDFQCKKTEWIWRLNENLIKDKKFVEDMGEEMKHFFKENNTDGMKSKVVWDTFKSFIRGLLIKKGAEVKSQKDKKYKKDMQELKILEDKMIINKDSER